MTKASWPETMAFHDAALKTPHERLADAPRVSAPAQSRSPHSQRRLSRVVAADLAALGDFVAVFVGGLAPIALHLGLLHSSVDSEAALRAAVVAGIFSALCLKALGVYDPSRVGAPSIDAGKLMAGLIVGVLGAYSIGMPDGGTTTNLALSFACWLSASAALMVGGRALANPVIAAAARNGRFDQKVAIFGAGPIAQRLCDELGKPGSGAALAGVFDERTPSDAGDDRRSSQSMASDGGLHELISLCREGKVDRIVIALPASADCRLASILEKFASLPVSTHIVTHVASDMLDYETANDVSALGAVGLMDVKKKTLRDWAPIIKRLEDVTLASLMLIATAPLWPVIALAIKLDSRGPILFRQARRGRHQSVIHIWKFRTMAGIESDSGVRQAVPSDPRVTLVGRLLRRTSLDELPQLLNVLVGDMSLVGPRPHALIHDQEFARALDLYPDRHQMRPGMTGLAQVSGLRGPTAKPGTIEARVEADLAYVQNWSVWLDLKILARTFAAVVRGENAN